MYMQPSCGQVIVTISLERELILFFYFLYGYRSNAGGMEVQRYRHFHWKIVPLQGGNMKLPDVHKDIFGIVATANENV